MPDITALFFDVGGVLGTNGWDRHARRHAAEHFDLDWEEYQDRHSYVAADFEAGRISLEVYLERTVFYREREFTQEVFKEFIFSQSEPDEDVLGLVEQLAESGRYLLATINNESRELNELRIERFGLRRFFSLFVTSAYVGLTKPDPAIYLLALDLTQRSGDESVFIDDRQLNLECAAEAGLHTIHYQAVDQLRDELSSLGITE